MSLNLSLTASGDLRDGFPNCATGEVVKLPSDATLRRPLIDRSRARVISRSVVAVPDLVALDYFRQEARGLDVEIGRQYDPAFSAGGVSVRAAERPYWGNTDPGHMVRTSA